MLKEKTNNPNRKFLSILDGMLVERFTSKDQEPPEGFRTYLKETKEVDKGGNKIKAKHVIKEYNEVSGFITDIKWYANPIKKNGVETGQKAFGWKISFSDGEVLDLVAKQNPANRFAKMAPNIDFNKSVELRAFSDDRGRANLYISQDGQNVPQKYTKDNPNGLPQFKKMSDDTWNSADHDEFLHQVMLNEVVPAVQAANAARGTSTTHEVVAAETEDVNQAAANNVDDSDPIPF